MSKFNTKRVTTSNQVTNFNGGTSIKLSPELELVGLLATGLDGRFYEKENDREKRLVEVIKTVGKNDPELVAKALIYARSVMGQRSVTHVGSVAALSAISGTKFASKFFSKRNKEEKNGGIVFRLDDMLEILAYYKLRNPNKPLPNSMKRGFKRALEAADKYELAKYQGKNKTVKLVDVIRLVRPKPSAKMTETFKLLISGKLKQFNTAEDKNTKSGQEVAAKVKSGEITKQEAVKVLNDAKSENWKSLILENKIGYLALLRNLRNIVGVADDVTFNKAMDILTNEKRIRESLVFPHQIDIAFEVLLNEGISNQSRKNVLLSGINKAYELAIPNLSELFSYGRTAVVVDTSGSMTFNTAKVSMGDKKINSLAIDKAALISATLAKGIGADMYQFSSSCSVLKYNPLDSINTIKNNIISHAYGGGTSFDSIFRTLDGKYDRVFIVSDMQGSDNLLSTSTYKSYVNNYGQPFIYSIDLCGYGTSMFKQNNKLINLFGYSSDIYEMIKTCEIDPKAILNEIRKIVI